MHGPPLQARVVAANRAVLATCSRILAHMTMKKGRGKCKTEPGQKMMIVGSRHDMAKVGRQTQPAEQGRCRQTQPADDPTGTGLAAKQQPADVVGQPLAVQCRLVDGARWCWPLGRWAQTYPTCLPPTYRLCLSPSIPTPLICKKTQFSPNLFFVVFICIPLLSHYKSSPNPLYCQCSANLLCPLAYSQPLRSLPGGE